MTTPEVHALEACALAWRLRHEDEDALRGLDGVPDELQELRFLLISMGFMGDWPRPEPPSFVDGEPFRAGYRLTADANAAPRIVPVFAQALAGDLPRVKLTEYFDHLWGVDLALWRQLPNDSYPLLAERWLTSPGRRMVCDLSLLREMHETRDRLDATDLTLPALYSASGADQIPEPSSKISFEFSRWHDLHAAIPGSLMATWVPKSVREHPERDIIVAFSRLERGSPHSLRGAAIGWLLNHTVDSPHITIDGVRQDLREALPGRLAIALQCYESGEDFSGRLEEVLLQHAARITRSDRSPGTVLRAWHLARWIHGCIARSPFLPQDEQTMHAECLALLPQARLELGKDDVEDPLHPARFAPDGLRIHDVALVSGIWAHYDRDAERLTPTPRPLIDAMHRLATRCITTGERDAEDCFGRFIRGESGTVNELGWTAPHIAPPWVARWLLTEWRTPWLARIENENVVDECLDSLTDQRFQWFAHVWRSEGSGLHEHLQLKGLAAWNSERVRRSLRPEALASMAIGLLAWLDASASVTAFDAIHKSPRSWQPFLFDAWGEAAQKLGRSDLTGPALEGLHSLAGSAESSVEIRLNAALLLLRRAAHTRTTAEGGHFLQVLADLSSQAPFSTHTGLLRELRRLGVGTTRKSPLS